VLILARVNKRKMVDDSYRQLVRKKRENGARVIHCADRDDYRLMLDSIQRLILPALYLGRWSTRTDRLKVADDLAHKLSTGRITYGLRQLTLKVVSISIQPLLTLYFQ
jgi:hypothetical protein